MKVPERIEYFKQIPSKEWPLYDLKVTLKPCFRCNHKCWFCEEYNNNTKMWSKNDCDTVVNTLSKIPTDKENIFFYFYGGEPTLNKYWEYIQYQLVNVFKDRKLFIQTQTNLSLKANRLETFCDNINKIKSNKHTIDICSSYHIGKQTVSDFIEKMDICEEHGHLGLCFFSTEIPRQRQTISEFKSIADRYPDKIKLRFTETTSLAHKNIPGYEEYLKDEYLLGDDDGKSLEFRYWLREYPELRKYFESGWNFDVNGDTYNFSEVSAYNIHMKFKYMKCQCGTKNIVIDHNLKAYHCNDDYNNQINITPLQDVDMSTYFSRPVRCLNSACYDGLDFTKSR